MAIQERNPTSDVAETGTWTGATAGTRYTLVDDYPSTDTADQLTHGTTAGGIVFGFSAFTVPTGSTINSVKVNYYDREATNGNNQIGARLRVGGTDYNATTHNPGTATTLRTDTWTTNPRTGVAWTVTDVNGTSANNLTGFGLNASDANPAISITSIEIEVDYTPPVALSQSNYAFYQYGSESGSTIIGSQNTARTFTLGTDTVSFLLRAMIQETNGTSGVSTDDYRLEFTLNGESFVSLGSLLGTGSFGNTSTTSSSFSLSTSLPYVSQSFVGNGRRLRSIVLYHTQSSSDAEVKIYTHSGTYGSSSVPSSTLVATNTSFTNNFGTKTYVFDDPLLEKDVNYVLVVKWTSTNLSLEYSSDTYSGNAADSTNGTSWTTYSDRDLKFFLNTGATAVKSYSASPLTEADATTNRLTGGTGSFVAGKVSLDGVVDDIQITASNYTEFLYGIQLDTACLLSGDSITFRVVRNGVTTNMTYTVTPTINISAGVTANTSAMFLLF